MPPTMATNPFVLLTLAFVLNTALLTGGSPAGTNTKVSDQPLASSASAKVQLSPQASASMQSAARDDCSRAPDEALAEVCRQLNVWNRVSELQPMQTPPPIGVPGPGGELPAFPISNVHDCMTWQCVCREAGGTLDADPANYCLLNGTWQLLQPTKRQEYRVITDEARSRFHAALNRLKTEGHFDTMVRQHSNALEAPGAHGGAAFLPWHREFLKRLEITLRLFDWSVSIPYWDSTLDESLPDARDSIMWTDTFLGRTDSSGNVFTGPFAHWQPTDGQSSVKRSLGRTGRLFNPQKMRLIFARKTYKDLASSRCPVYYDWDSLEVTHGSVHLWVGGHMYNQLTSPNDPTFFLHHGFVDLVWEQWRHKQQTRWQRENDYPPNGCRYVHEGEAVMGPFGPYRTNKDGLKNDYTDHMYSYDDRPTCSRLQPDCRSKYLFCNLGANPPVCMSKVRSGGVCTGFEEYPICAQGSCVNGRCSGTTTKPSTTSTSTTTTSTPTTTTSTSTTTTSTPTTTTSTPTTTTSTSTTTASTPTTTTTTATPTTTTTTATPSPITTTTRTTTTTSTPTTTTSSVTIPPDSGCYNGHPCCIFWANYGECGRNPLYMRPHCGVSCNTCRAKHVVDEKVCNDYHPDCQRFYQRGECNSKRKWMWENCQKSCNQCHRSKLDVCRYV